MPNYLFFPSYSFCQSYIYLIINYCIAQTYIIGVNKLISIYVAVTNYSENYEQKFKKKSIIFLFLKNVFIEESEHRNSSSSTNQTTTTTTATTTLPLQISASILNERTRTNAIGRSAALERAYVHDVYENCEETVGPIRPRVAQFLAGLDPGSIVCDVGSGNGRYLNSCNPLIYTIGVDRCYRLTKIARGKGGEVRLHAKICALQFR